MMRVAVSSSSSDVDDSIHANHAPALHLIAIALIIHQPQNVNHAASTYTNRQEAAASSKRLNQRGNGLEMQSLLFV